MSMPPTLFIRRCEGVRADPAALGQPAIHYDVRERLADFDGLKDEMIGEYRLVGRVRLTIEGPGKAEEEAG